MRSIVELRDSLRGETIWIVASGSTLNWVAKDFFADKWSIAINAAQRDFETTYVFAHHREDAAEGVRAGRTVITSEYDQGRLENGKNTVGFAYVYKHPQQPLGLWMDMGPFEQDLSDTLVIGSNTVTSAMDFAGRILGAATIILCGVDTGTIDGEINYRDYNGGGVVLGFPDQQTLGGTGLTHVRAQASLIATVAAALRSRGTAVHSLNPFVDLGLEGHVYAR